MKFKYLTRQQLKEKLIQTNKFKFICDGDFYKDDINGDIHFLFIKIDKIIYYTEFPNLQKCQEFMKEFQNEIN